MPLKEPLGIDAVLEFVQGAVKLLDDAPRAGMSILQLPYNPTAFVGSRLPSGEHDVAD